MIALASLALATLAFVGAHFAMSHPLRLRMIGALGEAGFQGVYSIVSALTLLWMIFAWTSADGLPLGWIAPDAWWPLASGLMLAACILLVGSFVRNPAFPHPGAGKRPVREASGVFAVTRHPMNWAFALWALVHLSLWWSPRNLIVAGGILVLALGGSVGQDRKKRAALGESWRQWEARTSFVPFQALLQGRARWAKAAPGWVAGLGGLALWLAVTTFHAATVSPLVWLWRSVGSGSHVAPAAAGAPPGEGHRVTQPVQAAAPFTPRGPGLRRGDGVQPTSPRAVLVSMKASALLLALALAGCATAPVARTVSADNPRSWAPVDPNRLSLITRSLASDEFEGRGPGTPGESKTVAYLTEQFSQLGLEPGGPNGSWTQTVPLIRTQLEKTGTASMSMNGQRIPLRFPNDIYLSSVRETDRARIAEAPVVFVGYGVNAPERGWDDFKGVDLRGKVALFLVNDPDFEAAAGEPAAGKFADKAMTYYGRWTYKFEEAARRGAVAALIVHETAGAGYGWNTVQAPGGENYNIVLGPGAQQPVLLQGWVQRPIAEDLFRRAGLDFETVKRQARTPDFRPVELGARFSADFGVETVRVQSRNVIAKLPGKKRPDETIMFSGHWDAYGLGAPDARGKRVRPGAADDALGLAGVLEIARAFKAGPRPDRTLLFAAWTAEERGLLGSEYFASNPLYPPEKMVANITLDTLQPLGPARDAILIGKGQSELEGMMTRIAAAQGRYVTPDSHPERGLFYRADHFPMAKRGVPVLLLMALGAGPDLVSGGRSAGDRWVSEFTANCYHQTCDEWRPDWDLRGAAQDVALAYEIGRELAFGGQWPSWSAGSEFRPVREKSAAERR